MLRNTPKKKTHLQQSKENASHPQHENPPRNPKIRGRVRKVGITLERGKHQETQHGYFRKIFGVVKVFFPGMFKNKRFLIFCSCFGKSEIPKVKK
jgi:hypothetical protein